MKCIESAWARHCQDRPSAIEIRDLLNGKKADATLLLQSEELPDFGSPEREIEWAEGQRARLAVLERLRDYRPNEIALSLTHSGTLAIAVGMLKDQSTLGIGVDLEREDRPVLPRFSDRICSLSEAQLGLTPIQCWILKEASFKANPDNSGTTVTQYQILSFENGLAKVDWINHPQYLFRLSLLRDQGWIVAFATCSREN